MPNHVKSRLTLTGLVIVLLVSAGCKEKKSPPTTSQIINNVATVLVDGIDYRNKFIKAERFDPIKSELIEIRVTNDDGKMYAGSGRISIDYEQHTMKLILKDVVFARPDTDDEPGELWWTSETYEMDAVPLDDFVKDSDG